MLLDKNKKLNDDLQSPTAFPTLWPEPKAMEVLEELYI